MRTLFSLTLIVAGLLFFGNNPLYAQHVLFGQVTDTNHFALSNVTVALEQDSTLVGFTRTDAKGKYMLKDIPQGNYEMTLTHMGYHSIQKTINLGNNSEQDFCMVKETSEIQMDEVVVIADKGEIVIPQAQSTRYFLSNHAKKLQDPYEALQEIASLIVNHSEKKISLSNGLSPTILVNGNRFNAGVDGLSPNDIEEVEIIEVPSTRYLKEGVQAIVNFKVKRKKEVYRKFNLNSKHTLPALFGFSSAFYEIGNPNVSLNINSRHFYFHNDDANWTRAQQNTTYTKQSVGERRYKMQHYYISTNIDWVCTPKDYFSLNVTYLNAPSQYQSEGKGLLNTQNNLEQTFTFTDDDNVRYYINTYNLFYKHTFNKKTYLEATGSFNLNGNKTYGNRDESYSSQIHRNLYNYDNFRHSGEMELYLTTPYKYQTIELGGKLHFNYDQLKQIVTHYPTFYNKEWNGYLYGGINGQIIPQLSYAISVGMDLITRKSNDKKNHFYKLATSSSVNYRCSPSFSLRLSYQLTNTAPNVGQLNPYNISTDSLVNKKGNPYLRPVQSHKWEIRSILKNNRFYIEPSVYYNLVNDVIEHVGYTDPTTGIFTETYQNNNHYSLLSTSVNLRYNNPKWGGVGLGIEHMTKFYDSQNGKNLFKYKCNFYGWHKKWSWNGNLSYMPHDYDVYSKTKYNGAESEVSLSYKVSKHFSFNAGMRYWLGTLKSQTHTHTNTYSSYSSFNMKDRSYKVMIGFSFYMQEKNKYNRSQKHWEDKENGINLK